MKFFKNFIIPLSKTFFTNNPRSIWSNIETRNFILKSLFLSKFRKKEIRFSLSYLIKIQIPDGRYFLIYSKKRKQFQPVGGAYKRYGDHKLFKNLEYKPCPNILKDSDYSPSEDLRFFVKGKDIIDILNWFELNQEREIGAYREFKEELLDTKVLDFSLFSSVHFKMLRRKMNIEYNKESDYQTIRIFDIFELLMKDGQTNYLKEMRFNHNSDYVFLTSNEIINKESMPNFGKHIKFLLDT